MLFIKNSADIGKAFGVELISSSEMNDALTKWDNISTGRPSWLSAADGITTINMAKHISDTRAKLTTLDIGIAISGSPRADYLQELAEDLLKRLPDRIAEADRLGGLIIKWNGETWDFVLPGDFGITEKDNNGEIIGAIFAAHTTQGGDHYTRLEYHRFDGKKADGGRIYKISNKAFKNRIGVSGQTLLGAEIPLAKVEVWANIAPEVEISNVETPLFAYYRVPGANTVDRSSPLGMSVFANALTELRAIDIAISRKNEEVEDSRHITFVGQSLIKNADNHGVELPRFVKGLGMGLNDTETSAIHEHVPNMLTEERIKDINFNLSMAGVKCGFSEGVFVMDGQTGMITATQVEADDRDTIQTIKTDRDALKDAVKQAIDGANTMATLYELAPLGEYDVNLNFGDITYNFEEDKASWKSYVMQGWVPKWLYFVKFEGMSEEEAKKLVAEADAAQAEKATMFGAE
ncbi:MAG: phage capsid protein [Clostridia bacterium]|nr:phage capsid protein [Clostridia bacterium]